MILSLDHQKVKRKNSIFQLQNKSKLYDLITLFNFPLFKYKTSQIPEKNCYTTHEFTLALITNIVTNGIAKNL